MQITFFSQLPIEPQRRIVHKLSLGDRYSLIQSSKYLHEMTLGVDIYDRIGQSFFSTIQFFMNKKIERCLLYKEIKRDLEKGKTASDVVSKIKAIFLWEKLAFSELSLYIDKSSASGRIYDEMCTQIKDKKYDRIRETAIILSISEDFSLVKEIDHCTCVKEICQEISHDIKKYKSPPEELAWKVKTILFIDNIKLLPAFVLKKWNAVKVFKHVFEEKKGTANLEAFIEIQAKKGNAVAQFILGFCCFVRGHEGYFEEGSYICVPNKKRIEMSLEFLRLSSENGFPPALYYLGCAVQERNPKLAFQSFRKATKLKYGKCGEAHYELGKCYEKGLGTQINFKLAMKHFMIAEKKSHRAARWRLKEIRSYGDVEKRT